MTDLDFVLLTVYLLCITYVLYEIINSFNDEFTIRLDQKELDQYLESHNLQDVVNVSFKFDTHYEFHTLKELAISINNKSEDYPIYVDWDYCSVTDLEGRSRRVTRLPPGSTLDLFQNQVFSVIAPGKTLKEKIASEDMLARTGESGFLATEKTIVDLTKPDPKKSSEAQRERYKNFMNKKIELKFALYLAMRLAGPNTSPTGDRTRVLCNFTLTKLNWTAGLPWNPRKKT